MIKKTLFGKFTFLAKNIMLAFTDAFEKNLFAGSIKSVNANRVYDSRWCVVDRLFYN